VLSSLYDFICFQRVFSLFVYSFLNANHLVQHMRRRVFDKAGQLEINENGIVILPYDFRGADDFPQVNGDSGFRQFNCTTINKYCELPYLLPHAEILPPSYVLS
jgi:hypothetical protein